MSKSGGGREGHGHKQEGFVRRRTKLHPYMYHMDVFLFFCCLCVSRSATSRAGRVNGTRPNSPAEEQFEKNAL